MEDKFSHNAMNAAFSGNIDYTDEEQRMFQRCKEKQMNSEDMKIIRDGQYIATRNGYSLTAAICRWIVKQEGLQTETQEEPPKEEKKLEIIGSPCKEHTEAMRILGEFAGCDSIQYIDYGKSECYILTKEGKTIELNVNGNAIDGSYMTVDHVPCTWCNGDGIYHDQDGYEMLCSRCKGYGIEPLEKDLPQNQTQK